MRTMLMAAAAILFAPMIQAAESKPNVLIVMTDDQGLGDFSCMGNPVLKTPHFDAFAEQAVRLTDFHVCPMCSPTRGQLMTGLAALRNGVTSVTAGRTFLRPGLATLPGIFSKAGYRTGIFGKWHLGDVYPHRPMDRGFQECVYHLGWGQLHSTPEFDWPLIDGRYFHNGRQQTYRGHATDVWFDKAMAWMQECQSQGKPFFCYLPTNAPHGPHIDLEEYVEPYRGKGPAAFFGMIAHVDKRFGDLERFLDERKLKDNTIVIFMTDNGGTAGASLFNAGLRGSKTTFYDGGNRVPCWIRGPNGELGSPRDIATPTQNTDLLPTLCELCGVPQPAWSEGDQLFHGVSLAGLLKKNDKLTDRMLVVQYGQIIEKFQSCVVWNQWRLVHGTELYDVAADRAEKKNLSRQHPEIVKAMRDYYEKWWQAVEPYVNEFVPQSIGAPQQPVVELTSGDWEGIYADNATFVRQAVGGPTGGHWHIQVETAGPYEFTLRRWPEKLQAALGAKYEPSPQSPNYRPNVETVAFPTIAQATVEIAGERSQVAADPKANGATVRITLPAGTTKLKAWFSDAAGQDLCGAFFVTVRKQ
jgi:arylsulfatase